MFSGEYGNKYTGLERLFNQLDFDVEREIRAAL
jgi:hypothetical protein